MELKDKVVFITGSTQGIGAAMAVAFARQGAKLIVNGRKQELPKDLKDALDKENADYRYLSADLAQDNLEEIGKTAWNLFGKIDVLINNAGQANYAAAKAGLIGFTKSIAREGALRNIRVNAIAPGMIDTEMTQKLSERVKKNILEQIPLKRLGSTNEVAQGAVFLVQNDYVTGQTIVIDGGMTI